MSIVYINQSDSSITLFEHVTVACLVEEVGAGWYMSWVSAGVDVLHADWTVVVRGVLQTLVTGECIMGQTQSTGDTVFILLLPSNPETLRTSDHKHFSIH